jgi:hypothetical protein
MYTVNCPYFFATQTDPAAKGYAKKPTEKNFVSTVYMLMDVLPGVTKLSRFQEKGSRSTNDRNQCEIGD